MARCVPGERGPSRLGQLEAAALTGQAAQRDLALDALDEVVVPELGRDADVLGQLRQAGQQAYSDSCASIARRR